MKRKKAKKVLWALRKVQRICEGHVTCEGCEFGKERERFVDCLLDEPPAHLDLEELEKRLMQGEDEAKGRTDGER